MRCRGELSLWQDENEFLTPVTRNPIARLSNRHARAVSESTKDLIADGVINAVKNVGVKVPVVVRLEGTNAEKARTTLAASGLTITPATDLTDAARKVVALAAGK